MTRILWIRRSNLSLLRLTPQFVNRQLSMPFGIIESFSFGFQYFMRILLTIPMRKCFFLKSRSRCIIHCISFYHQMHSEMCARTLLWHAVISKIYSKNIVYTKHKLNIIKVFHNYLKWIFFGHIITIFPYLPVDPRWRIGMVLMDLTLTIK